MADYREVKKLYEELFARYGGMMTKSDVAQELGTGRDAAGQWLETLGIPGITVGKRTKWETRLFAKAVVNARGMC